MKRTGGASGAVVLAALLMAVGPALAANLSLVVLKKDGRPLAGVVITAEPETGKPTPVAPQKTVMDQVDLSFTPDVMVIPVGTAVSFPNSDQVSHQVYSFSPAKRFQLPLYRGKAHAPVVFDQAGIVTLGCNIHDNMVAYIVVTAAPYFGRTDAHGAWAIPNAPEGAYRIRLWHPLLKDPTVMLERPVHVASGNNEVSLKIDDVTRPAPLKGHPHSWDY
jgi:plastocyanin